MLELSVAETAARLATADDVDDLRDLVNQMVAASGEGDEERALEADLEFHRQLFHVVNNPIFVLLHAGLGHALRDEVMARRRRAAERVPLGPGGTRIVDTVHYEIVDAVSERNADKARKAMRHHFEVWSSLVGATGPHHRTFAVSPARENTPRRAGYLLRAYALRPGGTARRSRLPQSSGCRVHTATVRRPGRPMERWRNR